MRPSCAPAAILYGLAVRMALEYRPLIMRLWLCCNALGCRYDKHKILQKEVTNVQYVACMNPTAGSFYITPRMQRHFATFAVQMPGPDIVRWAVL